MYLIKKLRFRFFVLILLIIFLVQCSHSQQQTRKHWQTTTPSNALQHYLHNGDDTFHWKLKDSFSIGSVKGYDILLTSQHWRQYTWKHQLIILSPNVNHYDGALLYIADGHNDKETQKPQWVGSDNDLTQQMSKLAAKNNAIIAIVHQVPNEPLYDGKTENELVAYTLQQFVKDGNYTWPLLFPMVKSAERAMDAVQEFSKKKLKHPVHRFVIAGLSKRGWTTWLTAATGDPRVAAIAPMSIDILNMPVSLPYQLHAYGSYSKKIRDFVTLGIVQDLTTPKGKALVKMIDPYSYRKKLTMPKMLFMGTNDPYWVIDNVKNYLPQIPGYNLLNYTPNAGHFLNDGVVAFPALSAFFGLTMGHGKYPKCSWKTSENSQEVNITVKTSKNILMGAKVWYANSGDMDFRNDKFHSRSLNVNHKSQIEASVNFPKSGYRAFYIALTYQNPKGGTYIVCTRAFMTDTNHILKSKLES